MFALPEDTHVQISLHEIITCGIIDNLGDYYNENGIFQVSKWTKSSHFCFASV